MKNFIVTFSFWKHGKKIMAKDRIQANYVDRALNTFNAVYDGKLDDYEIESIEVNDEK